MKLASEAKSFEKIGLVHELLSEARLDSEHIAWKLDLLAQ